MIEIAKAVKEKTGKYAFQFIPSECAFTWFDSAMQSSGTWFYDENEDADFMNNAVVREMFDVTKELWNNDLVYQTDVRDSTGIAAMQNGEIAFVLNAIWYAPTIMASEESAGLWGYTNIPCSPLWKTPPNTAISAAQAGLFWRAVPIRNWLSTS